MLDSNTPRMTRLRKVGMYLLSLWLLFVLIFVNKVSLDICFTCDFAHGDDLIEIAKTNWLAIICVVMLAASFLLYLGFARLIDGSKEGPNKIIEIENKNAEHLVFLATYVIPLVGFGLDDIREIINLGITLTILGVIYVKTDMFYANPTLSLLGFKIFNVKLDDKSCVVLISKEDFEVDDIVNTMHLDKKIYFAKKAIKPTA